jgi:IMP dehydrogenase
VKMRILEQVGLSFDDVLLAPQQLTFSSRFNGDIDLSTQLLPNTKLKYPLISANMDTVTECKTAKMMHELGGLGIIHRFMPIEEHYRQIRQLPDNKILCVGVGRDDRLRYGKEYFSAILIDVAHGHSNAVLKRVEEAKKLYPDIPIIAGNVATREGVKSLIDVGVHSIKLGVGPGSLCSTRLKTGCGFPQLTAIINAREEIEKHYVSGWKPTLIADGGIKNSGDCIKGLAAGADALMVGNLFAGTDEAPGSVINFPGKGKMKCYRGMASLEAQESWKGRATSIEGELTYIPYKGQLKNIFEDLVNGMLSGMSYQDAKNLTELRENAEFIRITSAGYKESVPHGVLWR